MKLQILVNHYKEDIQIVKRFLDSLAKQTYKNFEVYICSDGGEVTLGQNAITGYLFSIFYAYAPHTGVCHTRNILLDKSSSEYIMFCDIDDEFYDPNGLKVLMDAAEKSKCDMACSPYYAEANFNGELKYKVLKHDVLRVHGKIFKREFLIKNDIRYPDEMEISGDMSFLWLCFTLANSIKWVDTCFYIWKWNKNSVTREQPFHHVRTYDKTLKCYTLLSEDLKLRNREDLYLTLLSSLFGMIYVDLTHPNWNNTPKELRDHALSSIQNFVAVYYKDYLKADETTRYNNYTNMLKYTNSVNLSGDFESMIPYFAGMYIGFTSSN